MENEGIEWFARLTGPLHFRLLLQPAIAVVFGYRDGIKDAVNGEPPYFWNVTQVAADRRKELIRDGWAGIGKVFIIAIVLDCAFQYMVIGSVGIVGAVVVAIVLAILPYLFFRGAVNRWKRRRVSQ